MDTLNAKVESLKIKAREILRMEWICDILEEISRLTIANETSQKEITYWEKTVAKSEFKLTQLNESDPEYNEKKEALTKQVEDDKKSMAARMESIAKQSEKNTETILKLNEDITKIESGEKKVSIERVYELTRKMISNLAK